MTIAYRYLIEAGGLQEESSYPYAGKRGECKFDPEKIAIKVANFTKIAVDENQIAANLVHHGPLATIADTNKHFIWENAVGLNAIFMQTYIGGVSCPLICGKKWLNHGVLLVGYGARGYSILRDTCRIGSSRTHGENIGERRDITGFAGDMVCVA
ncbi:hypothetical protein OIU84_015190 [Salix udensis]|uniref:Peptidase C1A papain C-terminal domain-containing protein n=1 Tax=Salix udensis TaxID=889485 RepID=A0AAD6JFN7_9ROSI|nr:hypothetical protein OIU84_015190 [Salix udensis]